MSELYDLRILIRSLIQANRVNEYELSQQKLETAEQKAELKRQKEEAKKLMDALMIMMVTVRELQLAHMVLVAALSADPFTAPAILAMGVGVTGMVATGAMGVMYFSKLSGSGV